MISLFQIRKISVVVLEFYVHVCQTMIGVVVIPEAKLIDPVLAEEGHD